MYRSNIRLRYIERILVELQKSIISELIFAKYFPNTIANIGISAVILPTLLIVPRNHELL